MVTFNFQLSIFNLLIFLAVGVSSCDDDARTAGGSTGEGSRTVTFTLRLSGQAGDEQLGATRAMSGDEEEQVGHIHVLAFVEKSPGRFIYAYRAKGKNITQSGGSVQFKVDLRQYGERQKFVVLANSEPFLALNTLDSALDTDEIDDFLPRLIVRSDAEWKAHNTSPSDPADLIPMYGLSPSAETITQSTTSLAPGILLIRMLARLDVSVQSSAANFRLVSAQLFNRKNMGYAAYKEINWNATDQKVTAADMPTGASGFATTKLPGVVYPADASTPPAITRSIYTFETGGVTAKDKATALVVGGYYDYPANQSEVTYYRVDIPRFTAAGTEVPDTYGDILRNHLYHIKIKSVTQKGAKTAEEAFDGHIAITAMVSVWNKADQHVIGDRQFYLKTEQDGEGVYYKWETDRTLTVKAKTDYNITSQGFSPGIWIDDAKIEYIPTVASGNRWLSLTPTGGTSNGDLTLEFEITVLDALVPTVLGVATAKVPVKAGNLTKNIEITYMNEYYPKAHKGWAGSNIYWDGSKLTFDDVGDHTNEQYQGVFFQWGSLYGLSPVGVWSGSSIVYPPSGGNVQASSVSGPSGVLTTWANIPRVDGTSITSNPPSGKSVRNRGYLYEVTDGSTGIGDICKYLTEKAGGTLHGKKWRMPTSNEFEGSYTYSGTTVGVTPTDAGTFSINAGPTKLDIGTPFFPVSGYRHYSGGALNFVGQAGFFWPASPDGSDRHYLIFSSGSVYMQHGVDSASGFSVRCVAE